MIIIDANNLMEENFRAMKLQQLYSAHEGAATSLSFHPSGNFLASGAGDSKVCYVTENSEFQKISTIILHLRLEVFHPNIRKLF